MRATLSTFLVLTFSVSWPLATRAQAPSVAMRIAGTVTDASGHPLASAEVRVDGTPDRALTDARGMFALQSAKSDVRLIVRRLGFKPTALDLTAEKGEETRVDVQLDATPQQLTPVTVAATREPFEQRLAGFYERAKTKTGYYIGPERLDNLTSHNFTDILREVPGVKIVAIARTGPVPQKSVRLRGSSCAPFVFVDGFPAGAGEFELDMVDPATIEGVEIYPGMVSVPVQFMAPRGGEHCGVIALWSRPARPSQPQRRGGKPPASIGELLAENRVYTAEGVDIRAELREGTAIPVYPDSLWVRKLPGTVLTEFVVDTAGIVEMETVGIVSTSHPAFSQAATLALRSARFRTAMKNGRPVRQIVQLPFNFVVPTPH